MAFKRSAGPMLTADAAALTRALIGIGFNLEGAPAQEDSHIEETLLWASAEAMDRDDLRVLSLLVTWLDVHSAFINADCLIRFVKGVQSERVRAFWAAFAHWKRDDVRFARLKALHSGAPVELLRVGTEFQLSRHGEDVRFAGGPLLVPAQVLRDRLEDVLTQGQLAARHRSYRCRVMMGPSYRADLWAALEGAPALVPAALARRAHSSFAAAWAARRDFELLATARA